MTELMTPPRTQPAPVYSPARLAAVTRRPQPVLPEPPVAGRRSSPSALHAVVCGLAALPLLGLGIWLAVLGFLPVVIAASLLLLPALAPLVGVCLGVAVTEDVQAPGEGSPSFEI
jgi:hypothetical protein